MRPHLLLVAPSFALVVAVAACSGAKESDLLGPVSGAAATEPASADSETNGAGTGAGTGTGTGGGSGTGTGTGSGTGTGGTAKDAGGDAGGSGVDAGPPPPTETIPCGQANGNPLTCAVGTQVCCATFTEAGKATFACKPAGPNACGNNAVKISCNDAADCPTDQICCGMLSQTAGYSTIECRSSCTSSPGIRAVHFCDPAALVDECIGFGGTCIKSQSVPGYHVCG